MTRGIRASRPPCCPRRRPSSSSSSAFSRPWPQAEERAKNHWEQYLRAVADLENVRKRAQRDVEAAHRYGSRSWRRSCCPCRTASSSRSRTPTGRCAEPRRGPGSHAEAAGQGVREARHHRDQSARRALRPGAARGRCSRRNRATAEPNSVLQVVQRGYELNGRLLRPARVIVAKRLARLESTLAIPTTDAQHASTDHTELSE